MMQILLFFYNLLTFFASFILAFVFLFFKRGRVRFRERFGLWRLPKQKLDAQYIWLHGASSGEIKGLLPIIKQLKRLHPEKKILLTATSPTGLEGLPSTVDFARLLPFDSLIWLHKALQSFDISIFISAEVEWWPALLDYLKVKNIPAFSVNTRLTESSYRFYSRIAALLKPLLGQYVKILAADNISYERLKKLPIDAGKIFLCGNSKYDREPKSIDREEVISRFKLEESLIVTLGSIRPGEEEILFPEIENMLTKSPNISFILAPRHREKDDYFSDKLKAYRIPSVKRSQEKKGRVILLDTFGELEEAYSVSDLAFIGGTLVDIGGHNPFEAVMYHVPVVVGPHVQKISDIINELKEKNAATTITNVADWRKILNDLISSPQSLKEQGERGYQVWQKHHGVTQKIVEHIGAA
jgi:3-deoxy-D-manno-octulosonic-acid transferase